MDISLLQKHNFVPVRSLKKINGVFYSRIKYMVPAIDEDHIYVKVLEKEIQYDGLEEFNIIMSVAFVALLDKNDCIGDLMCVNLRPNIIRTEQEKEELDEMYREFFTI